MIKGMYCKVFKTLGSMLVTARNSFMEGWNNPHQEPVVEEVEAEEPLQEDPDIMSSSKAQSYRYPKSSEDKAYPKSNV